MTKPEPTDELPVVAWHSSEPTWYDKSKHAHYLTFQRIAESAPARTVDGFIERSLTDHATASARISSLLAEVERHKKDAERYRWLRTYPNNIGSAVYGPTGGLLRRDTYLDAAIDAAILESAK